MAADGVEADEEATLEADDQAPHCSLPLPCSEPDLLALTLEVYPILASASSTLKQS